MSAFRDTIATAVLMAVLAIAILHLAAQFAS